MGKQWEQWKQWETLFWGGSKIIADEIERSLLLGRKAMTNLDSILKNRDITLPTKVHLIKDMVFFSFHLWMWELDYKESWVPKNWCFWTMVLEKTLESPLDCKEIKPMYAKGNQSWIFTGRTDAEAETPILWLPDGKNWLIWKRPWYWERLKAEGEGDNKGWVSWMASLTQWTWIWVNSRSWWWTGKPGVLQSMGSQSQTRLSDWTELMNPYFVQIRNPAHDFCPHCPNHFSITCPPCHYDNYQGHLYPTSASLCP